MSELKLPRLLAAAKEFNIGQDTLIQFLVGKGFNNEYLKPASKLSIEMYEALNNEFTSTKSDKKSDFIDLPNNWKPDALKRIERSFWEKNPFLDLGKCGLLDEDFKEGGALDKELQKCVHIETLILSNTYTFQTVDGVYTDNKNFSGRYNRLYKIPPSLKHLKKIKTLIINGLEEKSWGIKDITILSYLQELIYLDLSFNHMAEVKEFNNLKSLKELKLKGNRIAEIEEKLKLSSLENLDLSSNKIKEIKNLDSLTNLIALDLSFNEIKEINRLNNLTKLESLELNNNNIETIEKIDLPFLKTLSLNYNLISDIGSIEKLTNLESLELDSNKLASTNGANKCKKLKALSLQGNNLKSFDAEKGLKNLQSLYLKSNFLETLTDTENMRSLSKIDLSNNKISNISFFTSHTNLLEINLKHNSVNDLTPILKLERLEIVLLSGNPILDEIPEEVIAAGWKAIRDRIASGNLEKFKEVKLLLLGNPNVGKSNLLEYLDTGKEPIHNAATHGIQYKFLENAIHGIKIHCWDFGGQEYFHATHQLFFSAGALHVILWSKEDEQRNSKIEEINFDLSYWIRCVEQLIKEDNKKKTEVIVIENKIDKTDFYSTPVNQEAYAKRYKNVNFIFTNFNLKPIKRLEGFKEILSERLLPLCHQHPSIYLKYLRKIKSHQRSYITINEIDSNNSDKVKTAGRVFHNMGIFLYFPDILPEKIFIKPQVLLDFLYNDILGTKKDFKISATKIEESIEKNDLGLVMEEVTMLLQYFNLVFKIPQIDNVFFIPQYLKQPPLLIDFFEQHHFKNANIKIESDNYLMNLAMMKIFSEYGKHVKGNNQNEYLFWKDGIIIEKDGFLLMVKFNRQKQVIELFPDKEYKNFGLQKELVDFILNSNNEKPSTTSKEEPGSNSINWDSSNFTVMVSLDGLFFSEWKRLKENKSKGIFQIESLYITQEMEAKLKTLSVFDYNKYLPEKDKGQMKKIFISYSKNDLRLVNKFLEHLSALKLEGKVAHWYCTELTAGGDWNYDIQKNFDEADIVCFMISPNFMRTQYIQEHEIKKAFERKEKDSSFKIIPIILDFCKWTTSTDNNLGKFTALPYTAKPVVDFINQNMAWYIVQECLRIVIDEEAQPNGDDYFNQKLPEDVKKIYIRIVEENVNRNSNLSI